MEKIPEKLREKLLDLDEALFLLREALEQLTVIEKKIIKIREGGGSYEERDRQDKA